MKNTRHALASMAARPQTDTLNHVARTIVGRRGIRTMNVARVRASTLPPSIRNTGMSRAYLRKLDNGHIRPVAKYAAGKYRSSNQRWEMSAMNRATGARRKPNGYWKSNAAAMRRHTWRTLTKGCFRAAGRGALIGAAFEVPFAAWREYRAVQSGKSKKDAALDGGKSVGVAAAAGGVMGGVVFGITAAGAGVVLAPMAMAAMGYEAYQQAPKAAKAMRLRPRSRLVYRQVKGLLPTRNAKLT